MAKRMKNNKKLNELRNQYKEIINSADDGIFLKDLSGRYLLINKAAAKAIGKDVKDFIRKTDLNIFPKGVAKEIIKMDRKVIRTKKTFKFEERIASKGKDVWFETIKYPILDKKGKAIFLCGIVRDITEWKHNENTLAEKVGELSALYKISKDMENIEDLDELFKDIVSLSCKAMVSPGAYCVVWIFEHKKKIIKAFSGISDIAQAKKLMQGRSNFCVPLKVGIRSGGGLVAGYKNKKNKIKAEEKEFISEIAELIGREIERRRIKEDLSRMFIEVVKTLSAALDARDHYTVDHSKRISSSCRLIAQRLRLSHKDIEDLVMGALLHDIGKIGVSDGILGKPSALTSEEFDKVKKHPLISENILKPIAALRGTLKDIRHHHERYDGKGYPDGLKGKKIPVGARIMCVCDAYDAMISERPYRGAMSVDKAVKELKACSGTQFDPRVVKIMVDLIVRDIFK